MKVLNVQDVTNVAQMPLKVGSIKFLQDANYEALSAIVIGMIGAGYNPQTVYILNGCLNTGSVSNYAISAGAAFFNGEIYLIDAASFTTIGGQAPIFQISVSQYTKFADPVTFTDNTLHNIHDIRQVSITAGVPQSGIADFSQAIRLSFNIPKQVNLTGAGVTGAYPDLVIAGPNGKFPILYVGNVNVGDVANGPGTSINVTFTASIGTANYNVSGCIISNGDAQEDASTVWDIKNKTDLGFTVHFREVFSAIQNIAFDYAVYANR